MIANKFFSNEFESKIATIDNISCKQIESNEFVTLSDIN